MRKSIAVLLVLAGVSVGSVSSADAPADITGYQGIPWGAPPEAVRAKFPKVIPSDIGSLVDPHAEIAGHDAERHFYFVDGKLAKVGVNFTGMSFDDAKYYEEEFEKILVARLGTTNLYGSGPIDLKGPWWMLHSDQNPLRRIVWKRASGMIELVSFERNREGRLSEIYLSNELADRLHADETARQKAIDEKHASEL